MRAERHVCSLALVVARFDLTREELEQLLVGEPRYRAEQLWDAMHQGRDLQAITTLPTKLRRRLENCKELAPALHVQNRWEADDANTVKWLWSLHDGRSIETVLMHYKDRSTACVSSQAGCAMGCTFCATGQGGFDRQLSSGEIIEQVVRAQCEAGARRLTNIVFMGMGEPLANYDAVMSAITRIHDHLGIGARSITVSTVGVVPGIRRLAGEALRVNLAVSLHLANDEERNKLVPLNIRYPMVELIDACKEHVDRTGRRLSFEWALIAGINDRQKDIDELAPLARQLGAHVNLIPLNPTPGYATPGSAPPTVAWFKQALKDAGVNATIRTTRGDDIDAACGQLRHSAAADIAPDRTRVAKRVAITVRPARTG